MPKAQRDILFPTGGVHEGLPHAVQPPNTSPSALNVRTYDPISDRARGGSRPGISKWNSGQPNGSNAIQHMNKAVRSLTYAQFINDQILLSQERDATTPATIRLLDTSLNLLSPGSFDTGASANAASRDTDGGIYVGGNRSSTWTGSGSVNASVWKLNPDLTVAWSFDTGDDIYEIYYDRINDRIGVVGERSSTWTGSGGNNAAFWVLDQDGAVVWTYDPGADSGSPTVGGLISVGADSAGEWYVCGVEKASGNMIHALDAAGNLKWEFDFGDTCHWVGMPQAGDGDLAYIAASGVSNNAWTGSGGNTRNVLMLTKAAGAVVAEYDIGTLNSENVEFNAAGTHFYLCTDESTTQELKKILISDGSTAWTYDVGDSPDGLAVDSSGNLYVAKDRGSSHASSTGNANLIKVNDSGSLVEEYDGNANGVECFAYTESASSSPLESVVIAVANGSLFEMTDDYITTPASAADVLVTDLYNIQSVHAYNRVFFVDGTNSVVYNLATNTAATWTATAGTLPASTRLIALYHGRIVLSGQQSDPHNWHMSAVGDAFDWDTAPSTITETIAVSGNSNQAGLVEDIVTGLAPFGDDVLVIGCDSSIWQMTGDPGAGGFLDRISDTTGMTFGKAWAKDPNGNLYFMGVNGVYIMAVDTSGASSLPQLLTQNRLDERFRNLDHEKVRVLMDWDFIHHGLIIHVVDTTDATAVHESYFYDVRSDGWWPEAYPAAFGPTSILAYDGLGADDTAMLLGCRDGYIRKLDPAATSDDGTAITTRCRYPMLLDAGLNKEFVLQEIAVVMGSGSADTTLKIYASGTPEETLAQTTPALSRVCKPGRNVAVRQRVRGNAIQLEMTSTSGRWAFESMSISVKAAGKARRNLRS